MLLILSVLLDPDKLLSLYIIQIQKVQYRQNTKQLQKKQTRGGAHHKDQENYKATYYQLIIFDTTNNFKTIDVSMRTGNF